MEQKGDGMDGVAATAILPLDLCRIGKRFRASSCIKLGVPKTLFWDSLVWILCLSFLRTVCRFQPASSCVKMATADATSHPCMVDLPVDPPFSPKQFLLGCALGATLALLIALLIFWLKKIRETRPKLDKAAKKSKGRPDGKFGGIEKQGSDITIIGGLPTVPPSYSMPSVQYGLVTSSDSPKKGPNGMCKTATALTIAPNYDVFDRASGAESPGTDGDSRQEGQPMSVSKRKEVIEGKSSTKPWNCRSRSAESFMVISCWDSTCMQRLSHSHIHYTYFEVHVHYSMCLLWSIYRIHDDVAAFRLPLRFWRLHG